MTFRRRKVDSYDGTRRSDWSAAPLAISEAQVESGIAGIARDTTGLALPGVSVEASSPALLEKVRTVATDGQGLYNITGLRPGVYTVVFTLPGFTTVRREGVELTSTFTATVNVEMRVGGIEEAVTVSGASPTVDIQNTVQQKSFTREVIDVLPTGSKSWASLAVLVPGAKLSGAQNVGGTGSSNATVSIHGGLGAEAIMLLDGMRYNQGNGFGGVRNAYNENDGSVEEITFQTGALTAEIETGSFVRNIVPRDGGNRLQLLLRRRLHQQEPAVGQPGRGAEGARNSDRQFRGPNLGLESCASAGRSRRTSCGSTPRSAGGESIRASPARSSTRPREGCRTTRIWSARRSAHLRKAARTCGSRGWRRRRTRSARSTSISRTSSNGTTDRARSDREARHLLRRSRTTKWSRTTSSSRAGPIP